MSVVSFGLFGDQGVFRREAGSGPINVQYNSKKGGRATIEALAMSLQAAAVALTAMPRVKIGPAIKDQKILDVEIAHLRDIDVGELRLVGVPYSGGDLQLACRATSCFESWHTGFKPITLATWMVRANVFSIAQDHLKIQNSVP